ncbi:helical backbone metal receptor [Paenibacillus sp. JX-17]|uniref:Helical backbone metal receptor n=1 Tax=Paenibacillus lacisoli TaxID=3064525 RepID=A0ABT9CHC1_9BACL|nr:helical backbone metal receptor [Paenibacillus sp. JX-17]MDO7907332.1 helical backbone metal receptor [Paenibacillus sp. JX-17]
MSVLLAVVLSAALTACGTGTDKESTSASKPSTEQNTTNQTNSNQTADLKTQYPLTVKDSTGESFTFDKAPAKIVSVSPAETEALFAIGLDQEIVGVSDYDDYPEAAKSKPKMGGLKPNEEALIAAKPDIVLTGLTMADDEVKKLRGIGIKAFKTDPKNVNDVINDIELYGLITDHQKEAKEVTDKMKKDIADVQDAVKNIGKDQKMNVYVEFSPGWTVGSGEFMDELITLAGGVNVAGKTPGWHEISEENIIAANPNVILYSKNVVDDKSGKTLDQIIKARSGWSDIYAIKHDRVFGLDDNLISRPGPRVTEGLKEVAAAIYPDIFK